jgi:protease I
MRRFEHEGAAVTITNSSGQPTKGAHGMLVTPHASFYHIDSADYDAVVFVGGAGASYYFHNRRALQLAREFYNAGKPTAAIDIAPSILANAHILRDRKATARPTERANIMALGLYTGAPIEIDENIITAASSAHVDELADAVIAALRRTA